MVQRENYCGLDIYDKYVDFQKKYGTMILKDRPVGHFARKSFLKTFHIYPRKKFWDWFEKLSLVTQEHYRAEWEMGFEEWKRRSLEDFTAIFNELGIEVVEVNEDGEICNRY